MGGIQMTKYAGSQLNEIRMPLGGIGAGCVSVNGAGRLVDWEISGYANKNSSNGFTHFAIKAEDSRGQVWARALHGDEPGSRMGAPQGGQFGCYGFGQPRETLGGLPHFPAATVEAAWPVARYSFQYDGFPGIAQLTAFSPFIPLNSADSSLPAAFFEWEVHNCSAEALDYTLGFSVTNPFEAAGATNRHAIIDGMHTMVLENTNYSGNPRKTGSLSVCVAGAGQVSWQECWYRGKWFDGLQVYWKDFTAQGPLVSRRFHECAECQDTATIAVTSRVEPGGRWNVRFQLNWYCPFMENDWNPAAEQDGPCCSPESDGCVASQREQYGRNRWRKWYAVQFPDVLAVARHCLRGYDGLKDGTLRFVQALRGSTLPEPAIDAAQCTLASLVTPLCLRLPDGSFYGWEGLHTACGCCEGSCTHVWNYAYALCYLFPDLERSMRDLDFRHNMDEYGGMRFRLQLPPGRKRSEFIPCADGQFGGVAKLWRDFLLCGDLRWLESHWPAVKKMIGYAWHPGNPCLWDPAKSGVLTGRQHHTLDMELFGPNSWLTGMYLAALKAAVKIAERLCDWETAREYAGIFEHGRQWVDANLFNGEYYIHKIDLSNRTELQPYTGGESMGGQVEAAYWDDEHGELKYQIGEGCAIDQVLGQWHANLCSLGDIFAPYKVVSALQAVYRYNYLPSVRDFFNPCRLYCVNGEAGTVICAYPAQSRKPVIPVPYSQETMHGFEYQAACHMVQAGMVEQGMELVKAVRDRYDGTYRNPFNEIECGSNYARSMASFALLPSFCGMQVDTEQGTLRFRPVLEGDFKCFFSTGTGWGELECTSESTTLRVLGGRLTINVLHLPDAPVATSVLLAGEGVDFRWEEARLHFDGGVTIPEGHELIIGHK